jgi:hypothetical protein
MTPSKQNRAEELAHKDRCQSDILNEDWNSFHTFIRGYAAACADNEAEVSELKLALADRSEKYKIAMDKGVLQLGDKIRELEARELRLVAALEKIEAYFCACSIEDEIIPQVVAREALAQHRKEKGSEMIIIYTPRDWSFGFGFYRGDWYQSQINHKIKRNPSEIYIMFGPWSISKQFGHHIEVIP